MKITRRQLRQIIREQIEQQSLVESARLHTGDKQVNAYRVGNNVRLKGMMGTAVTDLSSYRLSVPLRVGSAKITVNSILPDDTKTSARVNADASVLGNSKKNVFDVEPVDGIPDPLSPEIVSQIVSGYETGRDFTIVTGDGRTVEFIKG